MKLTREKINFLSKEILRALLNDDRVEYFVEDNDLRLGIVKSLTDELILEDEIDTLARKTINSYGRDIREGTEEWDLLYDRHYSEESKKKRGIDI